MTDKYESTKNEDGKESKNSLRRRRGERHPHHAEDDDNGESPSIIQERKKDLVDVERRIVFTDAAVAIALTLLILPLMDSIQDAASENPPKITSVQQWYNRNAPQIGNYLVSFFLIARNWAKNELLFSKIGFLSWKLAVLEFFWLLFMVFVPVSTILLNSAASPSGAVQYAVLMLIIAIMQLGIVLETRLNSNTWRIAEGVEERSEESDPSDVAESTGEKRNGNGERRGGRDQEMHYYGGPTMHMLIHSVLEVILLCIAVGLAFTVIGVYGVAFVFLAKYLTWIIFWCFPKLFEKETSFMGM